MTSGAGTDPFDVLFDHGDGKIGCDLVEMQVLQ